MSAGAVMAAVSMDPLLAWQSTRTARDANGLRLGRPSAFSFEGLVDTARHMAGHAYVPVPTQPPAMLDAIDYRALGFVHFKTEHALFGQGPGQFPVTFFTLGRFFHSPVRMHALEAGHHGMQAREILYDHTAFDMPADSPARALPPGAGFAGFRFQESRLGDQRALPWQSNDWVAFLGASYFRAIGQLYQYGLSARGIAIDTAAADRPEEFPAFTQFYFAPPADDDDHVTVYALLDGPSVAGAYRFVMQRGKDVLMDIDAHIFLRKDVERLGLAPLTSMYWYSETAKPAGLEWRPEVHDSDGLALWTGKGERIWRPLNDPAAPTASAFADSGPRGFGLLQRDRAFADYLDGVHYEKRPSLWVEPISDWGKGAIQLIELPTNTETSDNVVACWVPDGMAKAGNAYHLQYRLHWTDGEPFPPGRATCVATRLGLGGQPGQIARPDAVKFVVEFLGGALSGIAYGVRPLARLSASRGIFADILVEAVPDGVSGHWRAEFDYIAADADPVELRLFLELYGATLTETWLYQYRAEVRHPR
jgi:glucans biosynthesis protein